MTVLGATLTVISSNFLSLIISLELMSIPSYALVLIIKDKRHLEGTFKYLFISILSIALLVFGSSLIFLSSGHYEERVYVSVKFIKMEHHEAENQRRQQQDEAVYEVRV